MTDCMCDECKSCCKKIPGIPTPEELVKEAEFLKMPLKTFLETYCIKGWREDVFGKGEYIKFAYPTRIGFNNTTEGWGYPLSGGDCIFLTSKELCQIHEVKPTECRESFGCKPSGIENEVRDSVLKIWWEA